MRIGFVAVLILVFCVGIVSAGFFEDVFGGMTGRVVDGKLSVVVGVEGNECDKAKFIFDEQYSGYAVPEAIPFSDDIFDVYVDDVFFAGFDLFDKKVSGMRCEASEDVSYNIFVTSGLLMEISESGSDLDFVEFYNQKRDSEELRIEAVGIGKKMKLGFINFGLWVAGWFS